MIKIERNEATHEATRTCAKDSLAIMLRSLTLDEQSESLIEAINASNIAFSRCVLSMLEKSESENIDAKEVNALSHRIEAAFEISERVNASKNELS